MRDLTNQVVLFDCGQIIATSGVLALEPKAQDFRALLARHIVGDWGNLSEEDKQLNESALKDGSRLLSSYEMKGAKVYVITEADRSVTTFLLPEEY